MSPLLPAFVATLVAALVVADILFNEGNGMSDEQCSWTNVLQNKCVCRKYDDPAESAAIVDAVLLIFILWFDP